MNIREADADKLLCPWLSLLRGEQTNCKGSRCMLWQFDEQMIDGPDSYVSEPGPTGHCGLIREPVWTK